MMIYNEDCLKTMARMKEGFVDLVVTSPPYDDLRKYNGYSFDFEAIAKELFRVVKTGGVVVWVVGDQTKDGDESGTSFRQALFFKSIGFKLYDTMLFAKKNPIPQNNKRYEQGFEYMFCFSKGIPKTFNPITEPCKLAGKPRNLAKQKLGEDFCMKNGSGVNIYNQVKRVTNIFYYNVGGGDKDKVKHSAPFPEELVKDQINSWTNEGNLVYDPFLGSGTTGKVASLLNRRFIGSEINPESCKEAWERVTLTF